VTTGQVAPVAHGAHAAPRLAGEHRANPDLFDARVLDATDRGFVEELVRLNDGLSRQRIDDLFERHAPEDAFAERLNDFAGLFELGDAETIEGSAIVHADHTILSDVDETARQVTGVSGLERGIGETLTSTVRRNEVLVHAQAFAEV